MSVFPARIRNSPCGSVIRIGLRYRAGSLRELCCLPVPSMHLLPDADGMLARKPNRRQLPIHFCRRHRTAAAREPGHTTLWRQAAVADVRGKSAGMRAPPRSPPADTAWRDRRTRRPSRQRPGQAQRQIKKRRVGAEGGSLILLFHLFYRLNS